MKMIFSLYILLGIFLILMISGCTQQQSTDSSRLVTTATQTESGLPGVKLSSENYIVDAKGRILYFFTQDVMGESKCSGECINAWPIFYEEKISVSSDLSPADFGTITRTDGKKQTSYKGWPLYYFSGDAAPGDANGEKINNVWFIARPDYAVFVADKDNKKFIVDAKGSTLYYFTKDSPGVSNCTGGCLKNWPVFYAEKIVVPSIVNASDFGVITNSQGSKQTTYKEMPLYYYVNDKVRGEMNGEGLNNAWFVIDPLNESAESAAPSQKNATYSISVTSYPSTAHGDTAVAIQWEVSVRSGSEISDTAIVYGNKSGGENTLDYSKTTAAKSGTSPGKFSAGITIPSSGNLYLRAHAVVDGTDIFSPEYQISIIPQTSGGGY